MSKKAWLLDDGIFLEGVYKRKGLKHIFIPDDMRCGFNYQYVNKKDMGKLVFFSQEDIIHANLKYYDVTEVLNLADSIINMETGPLSLEPYSFYKESGKFLLRAIFIYVCSDTQINKSEDVEKQIVEKDFLRVQRLLNEAKLNEEGISLLESRMKLLNIKKPGHSAYWNYRVFQMVNSHIQNEIINATWGQLMWWNAKRKEQ